MLWLQRRVLLQILLCFQTLALVKTYIQTLCIMRSTGPQGHNLTLVLHFRCQHGRGDGAIDPNPTCCMCMTRSAGPQGREFTLVFRTFGADVAEVVEEMNAFATGQHPCYPEARPP